MRKLLGMVGVDSGQLLICDPCYIDGDWKEEEFEFRRMVEDPNTKDRYEYLVDFENYESVIEPYNKTVNQLIAEKTLVEVEDERKAVNSFSYNACCKTSIDDHQLFYPMGHAGIGVCFPSGLGDGSYEVWGEIKEVDGWGERITKIEIILIED